MALDMTSADAVLKELYKGQTVENLVYQGRPLLAMLPKAEDFVGRNYPLPLKYGNPQNRSAGFSTAVALTSTSKLEQFALTRVKNYGLAFIDRELMLASKSDKGAFVDALKLEVDSAIDAVANDIAFGLARDDSGYRGQVSAEPSEAATTVITLKEPEDVVGFEIGMSIVIHSAKTGGSARIYDTGVSSGLVSAINRSTGAITINTTYTSSGTIAADDYLFAQGDRGLKIAGLEAWVPDSAPSSTSFFGVDRSVDTNRLGGVRVTGTSMPIEEALIEGAFQLGREGGKPDYCFMNFAQYGKLVKQLQSRVSYVDVKANAMVGFRGIEIHGGAGSMIVVPDRNIRDSRAYLLELDTWTLASAGPLVHIADDDGKLSRQSTADAYEVRVASYAQLGCKAPGKNAVVTLD